MPRVNEYLYYYNPLWKFRKGGMGCAIYIFTGPDGDNFCFTKSNKLTSTNVITKNAATVAITVPVVPAAKIILLYYFSVIS